MDITATMVKALRERTGAGMMDCKRALQEADGDIEAAIDAMRKSGVAQAAKKAGRIAAEGVIVAAMAEDESRALLFEVNCETDFVARDEHFLAFSQALATTALAGAPADLKAVGALPLEGADCSVEEARLQLVAKLGENISPRRFATMERAADGALGLYLHGKRIGVIVSLSVNDPGLARDLAMHVAASSPLCVSSDELPAPLMERERAIQLARAREAGKPEPIVEKIAAGRLEKFIKENTLLGQSFIKDPELSVSALLQQRKAAARGFARFEVGEGLEKKQDNFAAEVMQQAGVVGPGAGG